MKAKFVLLFDDRKVLSVTGGGRWSAEAVPPVDRTRPSSLNFGNASDPLAFRVVLWGEARV